MNYKQIIKTVLKMHWLIIFGIMLIATGTFLTYLGGNLLSNKMHWLIIFGIVLIAVGTFLTYLGGNLQSNKVSDEIKDKLKSTNEKIDSLKKDNNINKGTIIEIENEFNSWAKDFFNKKDEYQLKHEMQDLNIKNKGVALSMEWRSFYDYFFSNLKGMIDAYNKTNENKIEYNIPNIPTNLYSESARDFIAKIKFSNNKIWLIIIRSYSSDKLPDIEIDCSSGLIYEKTGVKINIGLLSGHLTINPSLTSNKIIVFKIERHFRIQDLKEEYDLKNYKESIKEIIKKILEYQILDLDYIKD